MEPRIYCCISNTMEIKIFICGKSSGNGVHSGTLGSFAEMMTLLGMVKTLKPCAGIGCKAGIAIYVIRLDPAEPPATSVKLAKYPVCLLSSENKYTFGSGSIVYNKFRSVVSYKVDYLLLYDNESVIKAPKLSI